MSEDHIHVVTPTIESTPLSKLLGVPVYLKMDNVQAAGSFKTRGIGHLCSKLVRNDNCKHLVSSSGGNAGYAAAYSARKLKTPITVVVPTTTPSYMHQRLRDEGAEVVVHGSEWSIAHEKAVELANQDGWAIVHPFEHEAIWEGHESIIVEACDQLKEKPGAIVTVVGGGGLLNGIIQGKKRVGWEDVPIIAAETKGADSLYQSVKAKELIKLPGITSIAVTLGASQVSATAFERSVNSNVHTALVTDRQAVEAIQQFSVHHRALVEPACAAGLAILYTKHEVLKKVNPSSILVIVCGGNMVTPEMVSHWLKTVKP